MHLSGAGVFGPPKDRGAALAALREAVALGVNHIDTSDYYGPHVTNQLIREALFPYPTAPKTEHEWLNPTGAVMFERALERRRRCASRR